jgi:hypothetical protein
VAVTSSLRWGSHRARHQLDWSHEGVVLGGVTTVVKVAPIPIDNTMTKGGRCGVPRQEPALGPRPEGAPLQPALLAAVLPRPGRAATGACRNRPLSTSVGRRAAEGACTPAAGWEKGQALNQVGNLRERFFTPRERFASYAELNAWLADRCRAYAQATPHPEQKDRSLFAVLAAERSSLIPYPGRFDGFQRPKSRSPRAAPAAP